MKFGYVKSNGDVVVTDSLLQGGIVSAYYIGTLIGALFGGWVGEKIGRIRTIAIGAAWGVSSPHLCRHLSVWPVLSVCFPERL